MKILLFSDVHWRTTSSIIRSRGKLYSTRLEHLIDSMNWLNDLAIKENCEKMICAGDFFHKSIITDEELTALQEINWNGLDCYFLCGNHESSVSDLRFSAVKALELGKSNYIVNSPMCVNFEDFQIHFVPYIVESDRKDLINYITDVDKAKKQIIVSHNDINGIQYGGIESKCGFNVEEIEANCDLYLNGHIHNSERVTNKILNLGSFSGHNFTNDSNAYTYGIWILDTDLMSLEHIDNPHGFNFYKLDVKDKSDLSDKRMASINNNAIVSITCGEDLVEFCKQVLETTPKILFNRLTIVKNLIGAENVVKIEDLHSNDYMKKLVSFCLENIENTSILNEELSQICK